MTERRHFLGPTRACALPEAKYGITRAHSGTAMFIPITPVRPPSVIHGDPDCPPLSEGDESDRVMELQFCLIQLGDLRASSIRFHAGKVGRNTAAAIRRVQARHGLLPGPEEQAEAEACEVSQQTGPLLASMITFAGLTTESC